MAAAAVWIAFSIVFWIMNYVTDALTLKSIWEQQITHVAVTSTVFMVLSGIIVFILIARSVYVLDKDKRHDEIDLTVLRCMHLLVGAIPQLIFNFYSMSRCGKTAAAAAANTTAATGAASAEASGTSSVGGHEANNPVQIFSAIVSCIDILICFILVDIKLYNSDKELHDDRNEYVCNCVIACIIRILALTARIFALAYFVFYLEWWIFLYLGIRWILMSLLMCCIVGCSSVLKIHVHSPLEVMFIVFWFYRGGRAKRCLYCACVYAVENGILIGIAQANTFLRPGVEYCLYSNFAAVHISLNALCFIIAVINRAYRYNDDDDDDD